MSKFNNHNVNTEQFWEDKISEWETGRYTNFDHGNILEKIANYSSRSLRFRLRVTAAILRPHIKNKKVVEIGCGSGLMAEWFLENGAKSYAGFDIAKNAIETAIATYRNSKYSRKMTFTHKAINNMESDTDGDVFFSLGVLDWLTDNELEQLFLISGDKPYLHAISEKKISIAQILHRTYVYLSYGFRTNSYVPRYFDINEIKKIAKNHNKSSLNVYRNSSLSFGALLTSLPIGNVSSELKTVPQFGLAKKN